MHPWRPAMNVGRYLTVRVPLADKRRDLAPPSARRYHAPRTVTDLGPVSADGKSVRSPGSQSSQGGRCRPRTCDLRLVSPKSRVPRCPVRSVWACRTRYRGHRRTPSDTGYRDDSGKFLGSSALRCVPSVLRPFCTECECGASLCPKAQVQSAQGCSARLTRLQRLAANGRPARNPPKLRTRWFGRPRVSMSEQRVDPFCVRLGSADGP